MYAHAWFCQFLSLFGQVGAGMAPLTHLGGAFMRHFLVQPRVSPYSMILAPDWGRWELFPVFRVVFCCWSHERASRSLRGQIYRLPMAKLQLWPWIFGHLCLVAVTGVFYCGCSCKVTVQKLLKAERNRKKAHFNLPFGATLHGHNGHNGHKKQ